MGLPPVGTPLATQSPFLISYLILGSITNGSYFAPKLACAFLLFVNDCLVKSIAQHRDVEAVYADTLPVGSGPVRTWCLTCIGSDNAAQGATV